jgi:hypothetical protein
MCSCIVVLALWVYRYVLFDVTGDTYLPFLQANDHAHSTKTKTVTVPIYKGEITHTQPVFVWQVKCLSFLQQQVRVECCDGCTPSRTSGNFA